MRVSVSDASKQLAKLVREVLDGGEIIHIYDREGEVVLLPQRLYESLLETAELLRIPGLRESLLEAEEDIKAGRTVSPAQALGDV